MRASDVGISREGFGEKLIQFRRTVMGWTQERLARELGVRVRTIQRWERGVTFPRTDTVIRELVRVRFLG